jgi:DNA invertase Pin-like site-specific DNA recombinase
MENENLNPEIARRVAIYTRSASDTQHASSDDDQERKCRAAAAQNGWTVAEAFVRRDNSLSGTSLFGRDGKPDC